MGDKEKQEFEVIEQILIEAGITSREELVQKFDVRHGVQGLKRIGPKRRRLVDHVINVTDKWNEVFPNIPWSPGLPTGAEIIARDHATVEEAARQGGE